MLMPPHSWQAAQGNFNTLIMCNESQHTQHVHTTHTREHTQHMHTTNTQCEHTQHVHTTYTQHIHNTCTQHVHTTHTQANTHKQYITLQKEVISNQHGSSAYQPFHLVSTVNRFIMSHASLLILHQCLPLKYSLLKDVSIGEHHVYCFVQCLRECRFACT